MTAITSFQVIHRSVHHDGFYFANTGWPFHSTFAAAMADLSRLGPTREQGLNRHIVVKWTIGNGTYDRETVAEQPAKPQAELRTNITPINFTRSLPMDVKGNNQ